MLAYIPSSLDEVSFYEYPAMAAKNWADIKGYQKYDKLHAGYSQCTLCFDDTGKCKGF